MGRSSLPQSRLLWRHFRARRACSVAATAAEAHGPGRQLYDPTRCRTGELRVFVLSTLSLCLQLAISSCGDVPDAGLLTRCWSGHQRRCCSCCAALPLLARGPRLRAARIEQQKLYRAIHTRRPSRRASQTRARACTAAPWRTWVRASSRGASGARVGALVRSAARATPRCPRTRPCLRRRGGRRIAPRPLRTRGGAGKRALPGCAPLTQTATALLPRLRATAQSACRRR